MPPRLSSCTQTIYDIFVINILIQYFLRSAHVLLL